MKFTVNDIKVNDYNSAFEVIKDLIRPKLVELNKLSLLDKVKEYDHETYFSTDGITISIKSTKKEDLINMQDKAVVATIVILQPRQKELTYKIIKHSK